VADSTGSREAQPHSSPGLGEPDPPEEAAPRRADALANRERILGAAAALVGDRRTSMAEIAAAAGVGRATLYRHFPTRQALVEAHTRHASGEPPRASDPSGRFVTPSLQPPGQLGRSRPLALEVTHILDEVPPHLIADQLVAETRRIAGVPVALYIVDLDGSQLVRLAGSADFPERLNAPPALGPEIVPEGLPSFYESLKRRLPRCVAAPLWLRGRVIGLLLCVGQPARPLEDVAKQGAAALELANGYTDLLEATRRHKPTTAAAEVQLHLLPSRIVRVTGAQLAGGLQPSYKVGGDWFDFVENRDGAWFAIADSTGHGPAAAGLGAAALGALRAARRSGQDLAQAALTMDEVIRALGNPDFRITAILARWHAPTAILTWINCGHPPPLTVSPANALAELDGPIHPPLGAQRPLKHIQTSRRQLESGDRVLMVTDGIINRHVTGGGSFGIEGIQRALAQAAAPTAAATAMAIQQQAATDCRAEPLEDDATLVVLAID
jgi:serine phosphatase RsbU (regulator of sigma subunit)